ncbi:MAG TPA: hypothetical protein VFA39_06420 [Steroidobacteraceae bacterium]|nr:hypothetical protein [Steroidobacteraceae bacterium]
MKPTARLLLAVVAFLAIAASSVLLVLLEQLAKPLRFLNVRCLALIAGLHEREVGQ